MLSVQSLQSFKFPTRSALFKPLPNASTALTSITSPYVLTRREMLSSIKMLEQARDSAAMRIGMLASQGPKWGPDLSGRQPSGSSSSPNAVEPKMAAAGDADLLGEASRVYQLLCQVLEVPPPAPPPGSSSSSSSRRSKSGSASYLANSTRATPSNLLSLLTDHLPRTRDSLQKTLTTHRRPSPLTRFWFPLLFLPPAGYYLGSAFLRNKEWMKEQIGNAKETVRGFLITWVWEPVEDIVKTIRGGGEGLGVAPTTVQSDQEVRRIRVQS